MAAVGVGGELAVAASCCRRRLAGVGMFNPRRIRQERVWSVDASWPIFSFLIFPHSVLRLMPSSSDAFVTLPPVRWSALLMCRRSASSTIACSGANARSVAMQLALGTRADDNGADQAECVDRCSATRTVHASSSLIRRRRVSAASGSPCTTNVWRGAVSKPRIHAISPLASAWPEKPSI